MDSFISTIMLWPCNWAPRGWVFCNGQSLPLNDNNSVLFSLLGNMYGGDGVNNFMLPDIPNVKTASGAELRYIICIQGIYPGRD